MFIRLRQATNEYAHLPLLLPSHFVLLLYSGTSIPLWSRSKSPAAQATTIAAAGQPPCLISHDETPRVRGRGHLTAKEEVISLFYHRHYFLTPFRPRPAPPSRPTYTVLVPPSSTANSFVLCCLPLVAVMEVSFLLQEEDGRKKRLRS